MKKGMTLKFCPYMEYQIKNIFIEKSYRKCAENELFINLVNNPRQPLHARNSLKEIF